VICSTEKRFRFTTNLRPYRLDFVAKLSNQLV
jgi:hypothetical protein